jgi:hypothetical protein
VFERLRQALELKANRVANPDLDFLGLHVANVIMEAVVRTSSMRGGYRSNRMLLNMGFVSPVTNTATGRRVGISKEQAEDHAPSGTISAFLEDYPQYRRSFKVPARMAWWALPLEARTVLAQARESGLYGGIVGKSPYWVQQEEGMSSVGIEPRKFIEEGLKIIPSEVERLMREALQ